MGTPLSASFIGLLLLGQSDLTGRSSADPDAGGADGAGVGGARLAADGTHEASLQPLATTPPLAAADSVFAVGQVIDVSALTQLSGGARLGDEGLVAGAADDAPPSAAEGDATGVTPETAALDLGVPQAGAVAAAEGQAGEGAWPDEGLGDLGQGRIGAEGDDTLIGTDRDDRLAGGGGDDVVYGGAGDDVLEGNTGDDSLFGEAGDDLLDGGVGNDLLDGGTGDDRLYGGEGDDFLEGGEGDDDLDGGEGDDVLQGGSGLDDLRGGFGDDVIAVDNLGDLARENDGLMGGNDTLRVEDGYAQSLKTSLPWLAPEGKASFVLGNDLSLGAPGGFNAYVQRVPDAFENVELRGTAAHDLVGDGRANVLLGNAGDNRIAGGGGDDVVAGEAGDDLLFGGEGDDLLLGGEGEDMLYGEAGDDVFLLGLAEDGEDAVFDHEGVNRLRLADGDDGRGLEARIEADDLVVARNGADVMRIDGYVGHETSFPGIEIGGRVQAFDTFLRESPSAAKAEPLDDLLVDFLGDGGGAPAPLAYGLAEAPLPFEAATATADPERARAWGDLLDGFLGAEATAFAEPEPTGLSGMEALPVHEPLPGSARGLERLAFLREDAG